MSLAVVRTEEVTLLREENTVLRAQIAWLKKQLFGGGRSEKLDRAQLLLELEQLEQAAGACATETITYERTRGSPPKRTPPEESFAHLPVKETVEIIPEEVKNDPDLYERIGQERTFEVDIDPPKLFKREIIRPKYRHRLDRNRAPLLARAPARIVEGGLASAGLIAWALTAKYADHLPLYRQEKMLARWGAPVSRQNLCEWVGAASALLETLVRRMKRDLLQSGYVQMDETPVRCHDPDARRGKTMQGWLWVISRPGGDVLFEWRLSRRHAEAEKLLGEYYQGLLQTDGYEAYPAYVRAHPGVVWVGCWAHARRKFHEALAEAPQRARFVLGLIAHLYRHEKQWDLAGKSGPALRAALRSSHFALTLQLLKKTAARLRERSLPRSLLGQACAYLLAHWEPLTAHLDHGRTRLDNNAVENAIRPCALGRKNWLFIGHPQAGDRAAIIYSLIVSCQRRGIDPHAYLKDVLKRLPAMTNHDDLDALLPANWKPPRQNS